MADVTALVQHGVRTSEFEEFAFPELGEGDVLVRVEANGVCASDIDLYDAVDPRWTGAKRILGHEIVGVIEDMGPKTKPRDALEVGDRVCVNPFVVCGICSACTAGDQAGCTGLRTSLRYGSVPIDVAPSLWGGYSTHVYAPANCILYPVPPHVSALDATLWNPISGGYEWAVGQGRIRPGQDVLILGPGQRGLASLLAARHAGADRVVLTGLDRDVFKLDLALELGADHVINVEREDAVERAADITGGRGFDVVLDTTPHATQPLVDAVRMVKRMGTIVVIGTKNRTLDGFPIDDVMNKRVRLQGWAGQSDESFRRAIDLISSGRYPVERLRTHVFGFDEFDRALQVLAGKVVGSEAINVVVTPTFSSGD